MIDWIHALLIVGIASIVTIITRAVPFIAFHHRHLPTMISYLGRVLPSSIIVILVIYCLKDAFTSFQSQGFAAFLSLAVLFLLHHWRHQILLSIGCSTFLYMVLIRVFSLI